MSSPSSTGSTSNRPSSAADQPVGGAGRIESGSLVFVSVAEMIILGSVLLLVQIAVAAAAAAPAIAGAVPAPELTLWHFVAAFAAATALLIMLARTRQGAKFFSVLFTLAIFIGVGAWFETAYGTGAAVAATALAVLLHYGARRVAVYDLILTFGMAGLAVSLGGAMRPSAIAAILAGLSFYDLLAVYVTKHLADAAAALLRQKAIFAIIIPTAPRGLWMRLSEVAAPRGFLFLGTGDMVLPAMLVASLAAQGTVTAAPTAIGALAGLLITSFLFASQRVRRPMPALPPIALGSIAGYLITLLIT